MAATVVMSSAVEGREWWQRCLTVGVILCFDVFQSPFFKHQR